MASQNLCFEMPISLVKICVYVAKKSAHFRRTGHQVVSELSIIKDFFVAYSKIPPGMLRGKLISWTMHFCLGLQLWHITYFLSQQLRQIGLSIISILYEFHASQTAGLNPI